MRIEIRRVFTVLVRGIGQVMLQESVWAGGLMLVGLAVGLWTMAWAALVGCAVGTAVGRLTGFPTKDVEAGLCGYNAALVALAVMVYFPFGWLAAGLGAAGVMLSVLLSRWFARWFPLPAYTAPFILAVWGLLILRPWLFAGDAAGSSGEDVAALNVPQAFCLGWGQVMFEGDCWLTGLLFMAAVLVVSPVRGLYAAGAALLPVGLVAWTGTDVVNAGLLGYNGVLCAIALGEASWRGAYRVIAAVLLSVLLQWAGMKWGVPTLTAPFVLSVWGVKVAESRCVQ
ncbi:MAG: urea transporter [Clostridium sp.]|nr:urea transporter [Clostridium sp.]